jgi:hypothetical protein
MSAEDIRIHRTRQAEHFTIIPNALIRDPSLSHGARGCLIEILSNIDTWHITAEGMWRRASKARPIKGEGRDVYYKWFGEMETSGYLTRHVVPELTDSGRTRYATVLHFYDAPVAAEERTTLRPQEGAPNVRTPGFQEPEVQEPEDQEPLRRTKPKKDHYVEASSSPQGGDDDDECVMDVARDLREELPGSPSSGAEEGSTSRPKSSQSTRTSTSSVSREDRGPAEKVIARINDVLPQGEDDFQLDPAFGWKRVADLLYRFTADDLVDAVAWRLSADYAGQFYVSRDANSRAAVFVSQLGALAEEWLKFRADEGVQSFEELRLRRESEQLARDAEDEAARAAEADSVAEQLARDAEDEAARAAEADSQARKEAQRMARERAEEESVRQAQLAARRAERVQEEAEARAAREHELADKRARGVYEFYVDGDRRYRPRIGRGRARAGEMPVDLTAAEITQLGLPMPPA